MFHRRLGFEEKIEIIARLEGSLCRRIKMKKIIVASESRIPRARERSSLFLRPRSATIERLYGRVYVISFSELITQFL